MEEIELIERIKWLNDPNGGSIKLKYLADVNDVFINLPENRELKDAFRLSKYDEKGWKWHQLVRVVLEPPENKQYMYDRLLSLILKHRRSHNSYFEIKNTEGVFQVPNPLADLNKLEILCLQYFVIYKRIIDQIHFDYPRIENYGPSIKGKLNWTRTLTKSTVEFPLSFSTFISKREFDTPENILVVICAEWMFRESNRLLYTKFQEPLTDYKIQLLIGVSQKTKSILQHFPIVSVLNSSRKYWNLSYDDSRIKNLEDETRLRINQMLVHNRNYFLLLIWMEEFRQLNLSNITEKTPSRHIIEPIQNIDTIYEIWIFMEFIELVYEKGILIDFQMGPNPHCKFLYNDYIVTFWYERTFAQGHQAWILKHTPDFTAMIDDVIIAIFDAKNYSKSSSSGYISETKNKMLAYLGNLDANYGALIYPYHPKNWDDFDKNERLQKIIPFVSSLNPDFNEYNIKKIAKSLSNLSWMQLSKQYQVIFPREHMEKYQYPESEKDARYHHDQTLCLIRMSPDNSEHGLFMKEKSLNSIFDAIVSRIPISTRSQ